MAVYRLLCCVCPSRGRASTQLDLVLHACAAPLLFWERLLCVRPVACISLCFSYSLLRVRPDALLGLPCGWGPGLEVAGVTCTLSCAVPKLMLTSVPCYGTLGVANE